MKTKVDNPKPPFRLYSRRDDGTLKEQDIWVCGECCRLTAGHHTEQGAADCCRIIRCTCGKPCDEYSTICPDCRSAEWAANAEAKFMALPLVDYKDGPVLYDGERFFASLEDFTEWCDDQDDEEFERPLFIELCDSSPVGNRVDPDSVISNLIENMTEDFEDPDQVTISGEKALKAALEKFAAANTYEVWTGSGQRVAVPPRENT